MRVRVCCVLCIAGSAGHASVGERCSRACCASALVHEHPLTCAACARACWPLSMAAGLPACRASEAAHWPHARLLMHACSCKPTLLLPLAHHQIVSMEKNLNCRPGVLATLELRASIGAELGLPEAARCASWAGTHVGCTRMHMQMHVWVRPHACLQE